MKETQFFKPIPINNLSWPQAKARFPLMKPFGDDDKDGVKNFKDCKPFDWRRQGKVKTDKCNHPYYEECENCEEWETVGMGDFELDVEK